MDVGKTRGKITIGTHKRPATEKKVAKQSSGRKIGQIKGGLKPAVHKKRADKTRRHSAPGRLEGRASIQKGPADQMLNAIKIRKTGVREKSFQKSWDALLADNGNSTKKAEDHLTQLFNQNPSLRNYFESKTPALTHFRGLNGVAMTHILKAAQRSRAAKDKKLSTVDQRIEQRIQYFETKEISSKEKEKLGGGAVNSVYLVTDKNGKKFVFKPSPKNLPLSVRLREMAFGVAKRAGIPVGDKSFMNERAVAVDKLDHAMFGDKATCVKTEFAIVDGEAGILMGLADGQSIQVNNLETKTISAHSETLTETEKYALNWLKNQISAGTPITGEALDYVQGALLARDVKISSSNGELQLTYTHVKTSAKGKDIELENPNTLEGLLYLQVSDYICGAGTDRHDQNYFIDPDSGKVQSIDNDVAFGRHATIEGRDVRDMGGTIMPNQGSLMLRLPPVITEEMWEKVDAITEETIRDTLEGYITEKEIEATLMRLNDVKLHIKNPLACTVVENKNSIQFHMAEFNSNNSYIGREAYVLKEDAINKKSSHQYKRKARPDLPKRQKVKKNRSLREGASQATKKAFLKYKKQVSQIMPSKNVIQNKIHSRSVNRHH